MKVEAASAPRRCAYCHESLGWRTSLCPQCGTTLHGSCWRELGSCPTLGCAAELAAEQPVPRPSLASRARPQDPSEIDILLRWVLLPGLLFYLVFIVGPGTFRGTLSGAFGAKGESITNEVVRGVPK